MNASAAFKQVAAHLQTGGNILLFLDYDGTLVPIADGPDQARPDGALVALLSSLGKHRQIRTVILSGRPLSFLEAGLAVPGIILAGLYGLEIWYGGVRLNRGPGPEICRPAISWIANAWTALVEGRSGFHVEDKGRAVALHGRWAQPDEAATIITQARAIVDGAPRATEWLKVDERPDMLEAMPALADKAQAVEWFLRGQSPGGILPVYFGDDDRDDAAFEIVGRADGLGIGVGRRYPLRRAVAKVPDPRRVRTFLHSITDGAQSSYLGRAIL